jgi:hypothetical protein
MERAMKYAGVTVFVLFFGLSLLDAFRNQEWLRAALWLGAGCAFWALDRFAIRRGSRET